MDQILPGNRELLPVVQEKGWTKLLLGWLNQHDRPAVQVEALLALTSIADMFQQSPATSMAADTASLGIGGVGPMGVGGGTAVNANANSSTLGSMGGVIPNMSAGNNSAGSMNMNVNMNLNNMDINSMAQQMALRAATTTGGANNGAAVAGTPSSATADATGIPNNTHPSSSQYNNPYGYSYLPWNYDPTQPNSIPPQMMNDPTVQAAINGGYLQNLLNASHPTGPIGTGPLPPQPSSFANSGVMSPNTPQMMPNYPQSLSQNFLLNNAEAIPTLISLLSSPNREVHEHAMWMLGNIAVAPSNTGANSSLGSMNDPNDRIQNSSPKEVLISAGVMVPLLDCLEKNKLNLTLQRIGSWAISNLVETKMQHGKSVKTTLDGVSLEFDIDILIPTLKRLLNSDDHEILNYTCWSLSHLCDGPASHISAVVTSINPKDTPCGLVPRLVELLHHQNWR